MLKVAIITGSTRPGRKSEAVARCVAGSFAHSGQVCISVQRIYVNAKIRDEFIERFVAGARKLQIGHPHEASTDISSLITQGEAERVDTDTIIKGILENTPEPS